MVIFPLVVGSVPVAGDCRRCGQESTCSRALRKLISDPRDGAAHSGKVLIDPCGTGYLLSIVTSMPIRASILRTSKEATANTISPDTVQGESHE